MPTNIALALSKLFEKHRILFWYDRERNLCAEFETLDLPGITKIELANNEYGVKYRVLRQQPERKFLLYHDGPQPDDLANWLLDVQLAFGEFRTDQIGLWLSELELGPEYSVLLQAHQDFFKEVKWRSALKNKLATNDNADQIQQKMLAVYANTEPNLDDILFALLQELANGKAEKIILISQGSLAGFFWQSLKQAYGYQATEPLIRDFAVELFKTGYALGVQGQPSLSSEALVFLKRWKDSRRYETSFEQLSAEVASILDIENDLVKRDIRVLLDMDYFRLIDQKIVYDLIQAVAARTVATPDVLNWIRKRRQSHWYADFASIYEAIDRAAQFFQLLSEVTLTMDSLTDGIQRYRQTWFRLDQLYRKFVFFVREAGQASLLNKLADQVENQYTNNFLLAVNDRWQVVVDQAKRWDASPISLQRRFFERIIQPYLRKDIKVCVIISDALRYEIGEELQSLICQEDRYSAELDCLLAMLPSYTQLGMASFLPNQTLSIAEGDSGLVLVDGQATQGLANRAKILQQNLYGRAAAVKAEDIMDLKGDDVRSLVRENDILYIYHNQIDSVGDKLESEERVFTAVEDTLQDLVKLIKKLAGNNANNLIVTADHGFIYQNRALDESDFAGTDVSGDQILYRNRRFVLGRGLKHQPSVCTFTMAQLGLEGNLEVQIPKSINRLRLKGSGTRYVHGGASLQEVVIPVLKINKKRQSDLSQVEVAILRGANTLITASQLTVTFYQQQAVTDKIQPRNLRAGLYSASGELISDSHELVFDRPSDNTRDRETTVTFYLSHKAEDYNQQEVILRLDEKVPGTSQYKEYRSLRYTLRRSFTSDFDF